MAVDDRQRDDFSDVTDETCENEIELADDKIVELISQQLIARNKRAYEVLAK